MNKSVGVFVLLILSVSSCATQVSTSSSDEFIYRKYNLTSSYPERDRVFVRTEIII